MAFCFPSLKRRVLPASFVLSRVGIRAIVAFCFFIFLFHGVTTGEPHYIYNLAVALISFVCFQGSVKILNFEKNVVRRSLESTRYQA